MPYSRHVGYLCPGITLSRLVITGRHAALRFIPSPSLTACVYPLLAFSSVTHKTIQLAAFRQLVECR